MDLSDPTTATLLAARAILASGQQGAVYGGLALAVWGEPRETRDADFAVSLADLDGIIGSLAAAGMQPNVSFRSVVFGGNAITRVQILGPGDIPGFNVVDFVEPRSPRYAAEVLGRAIEGSVRGERIRIVSPEDFVVLKVLSTRDRDLEDAASVIRKLRDRLDLELIARELDSLRGEIPDHPSESRWSTLKACT